MCKNSHHVSLGFTDKTFPAGVHICQIFSDDKEREDSLLKFLLSGLQTGEKTCCFSEKTTKEALFEFFNNNAISLDEVVTSGAFTLSGTSDVYFQDGRFDTERMLNLLKQYYNNSIDEGYPAARVIGEMTSAVQHIPGGEDLLAYESKISMLLQDCPVTAVCQYDARDFDGALIMDILKVHPMMVVRGAVVHNPFYIPPEEFLAR